MVPSGNSEDNVSVSGVKTGHTYVQWLVTILVATTLLNYGLQNGWMSPMKKVLQSNDSPTGVPLTDSEVSWIASTMPITAVFGVSMYAYIADAYGRKIGVITMVIPQAICWIITLLSTHTAVLIVARIFAGLPAGGCFNLVPMYIKEISQDNIRGTLVALSMMSQSIGLLVMYAIGSYLNYYVVLWIVLCVPIISTVLLVVIAPESPAFLVKKGKTEDAARTIAKLRGLDINSKIVQNEIDFMKNEEHHYQTMEHITFWSIFKNKAWRRGFILCMLIMTALDLNGAMSVMTYAWSIMTRSGVTVNPELQTLSVPIVMILGSFVAITFVERFGRKPLLSGAFAVTMVAWLCLGIVHILQENGVAIPGWVAVVSIVVSVWAYAAGILPVTYILLAEMFNFQVRAKLIGCIVTYGWFTSAVQLAVYDPISNAFGAHTMFFIFAAINLAGALVVLIFVPETMGKSVEEIEKILLGNRK
ncbi:facilitated trehalose transporter Tret1-like [Ostrinia furnacalis]|uniref:facilitated trehalose transporter Tret1-like n=1 Tax=Ostrinia furnacalis TaxID=93504 RepID=UPI001039F3B2|nr:facilitated trehalose transporter Tret1-like [Ostrinia furnacalis]